MAADLERNLAQTFESLHVPMCLISLDGRFLRVSQALARLLGYERHELMQLDVLDVTHPDDRDRVTAMMGMIRAGAVAGAKFETRYVHANGEDISSLVNGSPVRDDDGVHLGSLLVVEDVTERKRIATALECSEARWKGLFANARAAMAIVGPDLRIQEANLEFCRLVDRPGSTLVGESVLELGEGIEGGGESESALEASPAIRLGHELRVHLDDGSWRHLRLAISPVEGAYGSDTWRIAHATDLTERLQVEDAYRELDEALGHAVGAIAFVDVDGRHVGVNPAYGALLGYDPSEMLAMCWQQTIDADALPAIEQAYTATLETGRLEAETTAVRKDGSRIEAELVMVANRAPDGRLKGHYLFARDITKRKRVELMRTALLHLSRMALGSARLDDLIEEAVATVARVLDIEYCEMLDLLPDGEALRPRAGVGWRGDLLGATVGAGPDTESGYALRSDEPVVVEDLGEETRFAGSTLLREHRIVSGISVAVGERPAPIGVLGVHARRRRLFHADEIGFLEMVAGVISTAAARERAEEQIRYQALHDSVTGLPNETLFTGRLEHAIATPSRQAAQPVAVLLVGIDELKRISELVGRDGTDELVSECAGRIARHLGGDDLVARIGKSTFGVLLAESRDRRAVEVADALTGAIAEPFRIDGVEHVVHANVGIAATNGAYRDAAQLLREANAALRRAKDRGQGRYEFFDRKRHRDLLETISIENDLRRALDRDELAVHYQPIFTLSDSTVVGIEALVRWQHPMAGLLLPDAFISLAERSGLIVPIGKWVLDQAMGKLREWSDEASANASLSMFVNLSAHQVAEPGLVDMVAGAIEQAGIAPERLTLEITETGLMAGGDSPEESLAVLKRLGVCVALDDFGTGYSSLSYLKRFTFDVLKVDRSFVVGATQKKHDRAILLAILGIAEAAGVSVIAEGVETQEQAELLLDLGYRHGQGFLMTEPLPPDRVRPFLERPGICPPPG